MEKKIIIFYLPTYSYYFYSLVTEALIHTDETISTRRLFHKGTHQAERRYLIDTTYPMAQQFINKERKILLPFNHRLPL